MSYDNVDVEQLGDIIAASKWAIIIPLILGLLFAVLFTRAMKKRSQKSREALHRELESYFNMGQPQSYIYGGTVSIDYDSVTYIRGNRKAIFDIPIEKETILAPCLVDVWFENRNYNGREANTIISDIEHYLLENRICKKVTVVTDEEYEDMVHALSNEED